MHAKHSSFPVATRSLSQGPRQNNVGVDHEDRPTTRPYVLAQHPTWMPEQNHPIPIQPGLSSRIMNVSKRARQPPRSYLAKFRLRVLVCLLRSLPVVGVNSTETFVFSFPGLVWASLIVVVPLFLVVTVLLSRPLPVSLSLPAAGA